MFRSFLSKLNEPFQYNSHKRQKNLTSKHFNLTLNKIEAEYNILFSSLDTLNLLMFFMLDDNPPGDICEAGPRLSNFHRNTYF